jgi:hypothetical protein
MMTELLRSNISNQESPRNKKSGAVAKLLVVGVLAGLICILGFYLWSRYSRRYGEIDHIADSLKIDFLPPVSSRGSETTQLQARSQSTYGNARAGASLKLPGMWVSIPAPDIPKPDLAHRFCVLRSQDGIYAMFWPVFPDFLPSIDADAKVLSAEFESGGFTLKGQRSLDVRGRKAILLEFKASGGNVDMNLLVIRKGLVRYLLAISGSASQNVSWKEVEDSLPESVEIR